MTRDITIIPELQFTQEQAELANDAWGCNCGPAALAAAVGLTMDRAREVCITVDFDAKRFMSPTMMEKAISNSGARIVARKQGRLGKIDQFAEQGLVRIQFTGPWTEPGMNPRWAYTHTHWIATWKMNGYWVVFDINGGMMRDTDWRFDVLQSLIESIKRSDGGWYVTHRWEIEVA